MMVFTSGVIIIGNSCVAAFVALKVVKLKYIVCKNVEWAKKNKLLHVICYASRVSHK